MPTWDPMVEPSRPGRYWTGPGEYATNNLEGDDSRIIMDRAVPFLRKAVRADKKPFLAVVWFHTPHLPVLAGPKHRAIYKDQPVGAQHDGLLLGLTPALRAEQILLIHWVVDVVEPTLEVRAGLHGLGKRTGPHTTVKIRADVGAVIHSH